MAYKSVHFNTAMYKVSHSFLFLSKVSNIGFARGVFKRSRNYWSNRCFYDMNFAYFCYPNLLFIDVTCRIKWYCWSHFSKWFQRKDFLVWYWLLWKFILCGKLFDCWFPAVQLTPVEFGFQKKIEIDRSFRVKHRNHEESPIKLMEGEMSQRGFIRVRFRKKGKSREWNGATFGYWRYQIISFMVWNCFPVRFLFKN